MLFLWGKIVEFVRATSVSYSSISTALESLNLFFLVLVVIALSIMCLSCL